MPDLSPDTSVAVSTQRPPGRATIRAAPRESRQRWRHLRGLAVGLAFETDAGGRFARLRRGEVLDRMPGRVGRETAAEELMRRADAAMYEVKRAGRGHWRVSLGEGERA